MNNVKVRQLFDYDTWTYTYLVWSKKTKEAVIIDDNFLSSLDTTREASDNKMIEGIPALDDGCVDFVALWPASDIAEQTGMSKRWVFRNYTVEIWDIPPSDPRPGRIVCELRASSYARIIDRTDSEYLVESPMTGIHGWLDKSHVKTISRKNPETKKLCKNEGGR